MVTSSEAAEEYRAVLSDLTRNDKTQINLLTILAEDYASYSNEIVKVIDETLHKCPATMKIVILYVVDSILKNIPVIHGYRDLFSRKIVDMIVHVFQESDERTRVSIYKLRCTWTDIFSKSKLYMIDTKINSIDRAWPILNPGTRTQVPAAQGHVVHVNPRFLNGTAAAATAVESSKPKPVVVKSEPSTTSGEEPPAVSSTTQEQPSTSLVVTIDNSKSQQQQKQQQQLKEKTIKKEVVDEPTQPTKVQPKAAKMEKQEQRETVNKNNAASSEKRRTKDGSERRKRSKEPDERPQERRQSNGRGEARKGSITPRIRDRKDVGKPESLLSLRVAMPMPLQQQSTASPPIKRPRQSQPTMKPSQSMMKPQPTMKPPPPKLQPAVKPQLLKPQPPVKPQLPMQMSALPEPTAALGSHAFDRRSVVVSSIGHSSPIMDSSPIDTSNRITPPPHSLHENIIPMVPPQTVSSAPSIFMDSTPTMSSFATQSYPQPPATAIHVQHTIRNETPTLPGVPENNRIFVDGKAYEVFYLEEAAVIERNGLPHRVSFAGPPRDVIVDGVGHRMAFGEQKQVLIDGELHILRFGAPSRELYMGNFPFKGAFGGPPIIATINGRRHEIRLCGPPPEVRIDPEPSYELLRYMPAARLQQAPPVIQQPKKEPTLDVASLLSKLKSSGILSQFSEAERKRRERQAAVEAKSSALGRSNTPPVPCNHRFDNVERRAAPTTGFEQFSMRSLLIRYDSIIDAIHRPRIACHYCGIGFQELYSEAYQRHTDWHLQDTLQGKDSRHKYTRSQPWFMLENWFDYSETEVVNKVKATDGEKTTGPRSMDEEKMATMSNHQVIAGANQDAPSETAETKECQVCHEQFEEYWDEEEDIWRLRDCVVYNGKAFHAYCKEDAVVALESQRIEVEDDQDHREEAGEREEEGRRTEAGESNSLHIGDNKLNVCIRNKGTAEGE